MPSEGQGTIYGNLHAYKLYTNPTAKRLFGRYSFRKKNLPKHHENVQKMLNILALNGPLTTWGMAKSHLSEDISRIRVKEKEYRRLLVGRRERGKKTLGVLDVGLVVRDGKQHLRGTSDLYRLSLHGILYCLDVMDFSQKEIDKMAQKYEKILPLVFGKWEYLKSIIGEDVYKLRNLAAGLFLDNIQVTKLTKFPVYEIMTYIFVKYQSYYEYIKEIDLADQISYWFYTQIMIPSKSGHLDSYSQLEFRNWKKIFNDDRELKRWYYNFLNEAIIFYEDRFRTIKHLKI